MNIFEVLYETSKVIQSDKVAYKIERVRIIKSTSPIQQINGTGVNIFQGVDSEGSFISVMIGDGNIVDTKVERDYVVDHKIDRFYLFKNQKVGKYSKKQVLVFMNFQGEIGFYHF